MNKKERLEKIRHFVSDYEVGTADNNILDFELLRNMINLRLVPGSTAFVKRQIVEDFSDDIFSILADDDTILLVFRNEEMAHKVLEEIKNW